MQWAAWAVPTATDQSPRVPTKKAPPTDRSSAQSCSAGQRKCRVVQPQAAGMLTFTFAAAENPASQMYLLHCKLQSALLDQSVERDNLAVATVGLRGGCGEGVGEGAGVSEGTRLP